MERRKHARLALCSLEALRSGAAYIAFIALSGGESPSFARVGAAALFAPQLAIPVAWFLLWYDSRHFRPYLGLIAAAKALCLVVDVAWFYALAANAGSRAFLDRKLFLSELLAQALFIIADISSLVAAIAFEKAAARRDAIGETAETVLPGAAYTGPDRIDGVAGPAPADGEGTSGSPKGGEA
jgi:hypothetical protein